MSTTSMSYVPRLKVLRTPLDQSPKHRAQLARVKVQILLKHGLPVFRDDHGKRVPW